MKRSALLLCGLTAGACAAQSGHVRGTVTDSLSREPLVGASVLFYTGRTAVTDANGAFASDLPVGDHGLLVRSVGYMDARSTVHVADGDTIFLTIGLRESVSQLDKVVVTAGKFDQRIGEVAQSLSVLRGGLIRDRNTTSLEDVLTQVPGLVVVDNEPQIRAGSGFSYGAGSRVMVLLDDMPLLTGDNGRPIWTFFPAESIEQAEVIKGASSALYGSAALSGVINLRTTYAGNDPRTRATVFSGAWDAPGHKPAKWWSGDPPLFGGATFNHAQRYGRLDLVLGGMAFSDDGFVGPERLAPDSLARDPFRTGAGGYENRVRFNASMRWRGRKVPGLSFGVGGNIMRSRNSAVLLWDDTDRGLYRPSPGTTTITTGTQYTIDPFIKYVTPQGSRHILRMRYYHHLFDNNNDQSNEGGSSYAEYQFQRRLHALGETVITAGVVGQSIVSDAALYAGGSEGGGHHTARSGALYLQADKKFLDKLTLSAGLRYEDLSVAGEQQSAPVFRAGATYRVLRATYLRASYGQGFRFPTIGERYIRTSVGQLNIYPSPGLKPERSYNVEGGIKQGFKLGGFAGYVDVVAFQQDFEDYIEFTFGVWARPAPTNLGGLGFRSLNTGGARITGVEVEAVASGLVGPVKVDLLAGYTTTKPISTTPARTYDEGSFALPGSPPTNYLATSYDTTGHLLKFRVERLFRADVGLSYKRFSAGVSVRYNSHVRNIDRIFADLDLAGVLSTGVDAWMRTHTTGDLITDLRFAYGITKQVKAAFIINNITNEVYAIRPMAIEAPRSYQVQLVLDL